MKSWEEFLEEMNEGMFGGMDSLRTIEKIMGPQNYEAFRNLKYNADYKNAVDNIMMQVGNTRANDMNAFKAIAAKAMQLVSQANQSQAADTGHAWGNTNNSHFR